MVTEILLILYIISLNVKLYYCYHNMINGILLDVFVNGENLLALGMEAILVCKCKTNFRFESTITRNIS